MISRKCLVGGKSFGINAFVNTPLKPINKLIIDVALLENTPDPVNKILKFCEDNKEVINNNMDSLLYVIDVNNNNYHDITTDNSILVLPKENDDEQNIISDNMDHLLNILEGHIQKIADASEIFIRQCTPLLHSVLDCSQQQRFKEELNKINFIDLFGKLCKF
jgi:hypothetical protein